MITVNEFANQSVGVFGLGKAGEAAIASLTIGGAKVFAWDDKPPKSAVPLVPYKDWPWGELQVLVLSPGVPLSHPVVAQAKKHECKVIGEVELLYRAQPDAIYVGITGTNGKSTTTTLIAHILEKCGVICQVGGNLGVPALALEPLGKGGVYVIEMSSYQLDLVKTTRFNVALLLNITPDHLDRHGDMEGYIAAKMHIFDRQTQNDVAVIAVDDDYTKKMVASEKWKAKGKGQLIQVSAQQALNNGVYVENGRLHDTKLKYDSSFDLTKIPTLPGRHNWQNAAAAWAAARALGIEADAIYAAMKTFPGLRHRLQTVATIKGVCFINDSKATNADATSNALAAYETIYWIAGGKPKAGGIKTLESFFPKIAHAFLIGEAEEEFARTLEGKVAYTHCGTLAVAVQKAAAMAFAENKKDAIALLSPACASFDQFKNFEERGDAFCDLVSQL